MPDPRLMLTPGPEVTSVRVRAAAGRGDAGYREPGFAEVLRSIRAALPGALHVPGHEAVLATGSGATAMEPAVVSSVRPGRALLVVHNGVHGERLKHIAAAQQIPCHEVAGDWFTPIEVDAVDAALRAHPDVDAVVCVQHETSTGVINPIKEIGALTRDTDVVFVLGAAGAAGIEDPDLGEVAADIIVGASGNGLHGLAGTSFVLASPKGVDRFRQVPERNIYGHTATYLEGRQRWAPPTPAVQGCFALDEAIREFVDLGGFAARTAVYRERAALIRDGFAGLGLRMRIAPEHRSRSVTLLHLPAGVAFDVLRAELERAGYIIYPGQGPLAQEYFRVCTMGELPLPVVERFLGDLGHTLATLSR